MINKSLQPLGANGFAGRLTVVGEILSQVEECEGHQDVESPVHPRSAGVSGAPGPQGIDLGVDGPRHGTHSWETTQEEDASVILILKQKK